MINRINYLVILSLFCFCNSVLSPQNFISRTYTVEDGLPDAKVFDVLQDSSGLMWFATRSGICTYDGNEWKMITEEENIFNIKYIRLKTDVSKNIWGLPSSTINPILIIRVTGKIDSLKIPLENSWWVGENSSFDFFDDQGKTKLVIGTRGRNIFYYTEDKWEEISFSNNYPKSLITGIAFQNADSVFVTTRVGLFLLQLDSKDFTKINLNFPQKGVYFIKRINYLDSEIKYWLLGNDFIGYLENNQFKLVLDKTNMPFGIRKDFFYLTEYFNKGVFYGNGVSYFYLRYDAGVGDSGIAENRPRYVSTGAYSLYVDYEGSVWTVRARGITKSIEVPFHNYKSDDGLLENEVTAISELSDGELVLGHNSGFTLFSDEQVTPIKFNDPDYHPSIINRVLDICKDLNGNVFLISLKQGVFRIDNKRNINLINHEQKLKYMSIACDANNEIWISTDTDLFKLNGAKLVKVKNPVFQNKTIRRLYFADDGTLFAGTPRGLIRYKSPKSSIINGPNLDANNIYTIYKHNIFGVLVGTSAGLYVIIGDSLHKFIYNNFSIDRPVYFIIEDHQGQLWFGTNYGVYKWDGTNSVHYTTVDGLSGNETNRAAGFVDKEGNVWIGTESGLSKFSPGNTVSKSIRPKISFLYLSDSQNHKYKSTSTIQLNSSQHSLSFYYQGYSFIDEARNLYEIELLNLENNSKNVFKTKENVVRFSNMSPGTYRFSVRFKNAKGIWSNKIVGATFFIASPFYYRFWFYGGLVLLVSFVVFLIMQRSSRLKMIRSAEKQMIRSSAILETTENERKRITRDLHDGLGQLLASAKLKIELFNQKVGIKDNELDAAVDLILEARNEIKNLIYDLHPSEIERYGLSAALKIMCEKIQEDTSINAKCNCNNYVKIKKRNLEIMVYRIVQEALSNVIKHSGASQVDVNLNRNSSGISITIKDNGAGFKFGGFDSCEGNGMGLINMYERTNILGGNLKIDSTKGSGTIIQINIPV